MPCYTIHMSRILFYVILCPSFLFGFLFAHPLHAYTFTRSLYLGSSGLDVRELQKVLNSDPQTQIAVSGAGSPGNETMTFGNLTRLAVMKFQEKYPIDILQPAGLVFGNGRVGPFTLRKLNNVQNMALNRPIPFILADQSIDLKTKASEKTDIYATDKKIKAIQDQFNAEINRAMAARVAPALGSVVDTASRYVPPVIVSGLSSIVAKPGSKVVISGRGFDSSSVIYLGNDYIIRNPQVIAAGSITFTVPSIPYNKYDLAVRTSKDISNSVFFVVAPSTVSSVSVSSIQPSPVRFGETVTITGSGFTALNNEIHSPVGIIKGVSSSDGKTLSFTFSPDVFKEMAKYSQNTRTQPLHIWVVNSNGYTQAKEFVLSY